MHLCVSLMMSRLFFVFPQQSFCTNQLPMVSCRSRLNKIQICTNTHIKTHKQNYIHMCTEKEMLAKELANCLRWMLQTNGCLIVI